MRYLYLLFFLVLGCRREPSMEVFRDSLTDTKIIRDCVNSFMPKNSVLSMSVCKIYLPNTESATCYIHTDVVVPTSCSFYDTIKKNKTN